MDMGTLSEMFSFSLVTQSVVLRLKVASASPEVGKETRDLVTFTSVLLRIYILTRSLILIQISVGSIILMSIGLTQVNDLTSLRIQGALKTWCFTHVFTN